jgi:hypothetical protein
VTWRGKADSSLAVAGAPGCGRNDKVYFDEGLRSAKALRHPKSEFGYPRGTEAPLFHFVFGFHFAAGVLQRRFARSNLASNLS